MRSKLHADVARGREIGRLLGAWTVEPGRRRDEKVGSRQQLEAQDDIRQWQRAGLGGYIKPVTWQRCG